MFFCIVLHFCDCAFVALSECFWTTIAIQMVKEKAFYQFRFFRPVGDF